MPKVSKHVARNNIYKLGLKTPADNKQGFKLDRSKPRNEDDTILVCKGETYYTWAFKYGGRKYSTTPPTKYQLTQNAFLHSVYGIEDTIAEISADSVEDLENALEEIKSSVEDLRDEAQGSLDNMPEQLQESSPLYERVENLQAFYDDLDNIDLDYDEPTDEDLLDDLTIDDEVDHDQEEIDALREEKLREFLDEKIQEIQDATLNY